MSELASADVLALGGALFVAVLGFVTSFAAVSKAMEPDFGARAGRARHPRGGAAGGAVAVLG